MNITNWHVLLICLGEFYLWLSPLHIRLMLLLFSRMPPLSMLNTGKQTSQFFDSVDVWNPHLTQNEKKYRLKTLEQYSREHNTNEQPGKQYFKATTLPEIINLTPMPTSKSSRQGHELDKGNSSCLFFFFSLLMSPQSWTIERRLLISVRVYWIWILLHGGLLSKQDCTRLSRARSLLNLLWFEFFFLLLWCLLISELT